MSKSLKKKVFEITSTMDKMKKDSTNPFFNSKYFDVNQLIEAIRPELIKHDLLLLQPIQNGEVGSVIYDVETGDSISSFIPLPELNDPQKIGSAITYYRRYSLQSLLGIEAEDDDGNKASSYKPKSYTQTDDNKEWLGEEMTKEWQNAEDKIRRGEILPKDLRKHYKVSKVNMAHFERIQREVSGN